MELRNDGRRDVAAQANARVASAAATNRRQALEATNARRRGPPGRCLAGDDLTLHHGPVRAVGGGPADVESFILSQLSGSGLEA